MSPEVWQAARALIEERAIALNLPVQWPNADFVTPPPPSLWLAIDLAAESAEAIELGIHTWMETGSVWLHLMVPLNSGIDTALVYRKSLATAFRVTPPTNVGLYWDRHTFDPLSPDDGVWRRLSVAISYRFTDIPALGVEAAAAFPGVADMDATAA